ncbi:MAG: branched-chain amino acid transaminase [Anaerolineaceae bacterium]
MGNNPKYIWMDGELVEFEKATVPFLCSGLHYGLGVFEGIRCYATPRGPAVFRLKDHMERLLNSARVLGFRDLPHTVSELCEATREIIRANDLQTCYIRPLLFGNGAYPSLNLDNCAAKVGIAAWDWGAYLGPEAAEKGVRANVSSFTRHHPNVMMTKAKVTGNYANSVLAKTESIRLGFDEAIMLDPQGFVAECSGENLFLVRNGGLVSAHTATVLEGITRDSILNLAHDEGIPVIQQPISRDQLYIADEVFVCGTAAEVIAVTEIDFRAIGSGKMGPITRQIQKIFQSVITGSHPRSVEWLDYVNESVFAKN